MTRGTTTATMLANVRLCASFRQPANVAISWTTYRWRRTPVSIVVAANAMTTTAAKMTARSSGMPRLCANSPTPAVKLAVAPPDAVAKSGYMVSHSVRDAAAPAVTASSAPTARLPSPMAPTLPTYRASVSLSSCFDVVPDDTREWKPDTAPQAIVMNRNGKIDGVPSGTSLNAGAEIVFQPTSMPAAMTPRAMNS